MPKTPDYPAAHSMDTTWFAVDADGVVAEFHTDEDGALPNAAFTGDSLADDDNLYEALESKLLTAMILRGDNRQTPGQIDGLLLGLRQPVLAFVALAEPGAAEALPESRYWVFHPAAPRIARSRGPVSPEALRQLAASGRLLALFTGVEISQQVEEEAAGMSLVRYRRDFGEDPGAYVHLAVPEKPVRVQDLEPELAESVSRLRLPVRFAETKKLHLADHMRDEDASFWGEGWTLRGFGEPEPGPSVDPGKKGPKLLTILLGLLALIPVFLVFLGMLAWLFLKPVAAP